MVKVNKTLAKTTATAAFLIAATTGVAASEVRLTLKNQDFVIVGDFAGFQQDAYVVATQSGNLHVPAKFVDCEGDDCLIIVSADAEG